MADRLCGKEPHLQYQLQEGKRGNGALDVYAIAKRVALNPLSTTVARMSETSSATWEDAAA
jgi:hypothetical protein